jgi:hypothetical protein
MPSKKLTEQQRETAEYLGTSYRYRLPGGIIGTSRRLANNSMQWLYIFDDGTISRFT